MKLVIPGRRKAANPESSNLHSGLSALWASTRNDAAYDSNFEIDPLAFCSARVIPRPTVAGRMLLGTTSLLCFTTPVTYLYMERFNEWASRRIARVWRRGRESAAA